MATKKKMLQAAAGNAGGAGLDITDVFSTYLYEGNGSTQTITNGIDLSGEGGLVWQKIRTGTYSHSFVDTERGGQNTLQSNGTDAQVDRGSDFITSFNSDGFSIGADALINQSGQDYASWTFRKAPKFFDVVTYTGTGVARTIAHNLGSAPGMIICKPTSGTGQWAVWHRSNGDDKVLYLNLTYANSTSNTVWNNTSPTSTVFSAGASAATNENGVTYVAYLFAHNDSGDGGFGPDGDQDIIKCGSYTGNGSTTGPEIDLGFEPQWVLVKSSTQTADWTMYDNMRGAVTGTTGSKYLHPNKSDAEATRGFSFLSNGFQPRNSGTDSNTSGQTYIYMAIRRGPLAQPESGTEVFAPTLGNAVSSTPTYNGGFVADFAISGESARSSSGGHYTASRMTGSNFMLPHNNQAEGTASSLKWDYMNGAHSDAGWTGRIGWLWKRAPGFCDVVAYSGDGVAGRTVSHNLGVAPEMIWVKSRNVSGSWRVYHKDIGNTGGITINLSNAAFTLSTLWNDTSPTSTDFTLGTYGEVNTNGNTHIAYLFATVPGVSKVGSVSHTNGTDTNVDCGFSSGARFILLKRTDGASSWYVWDTARGIVAGDDKVLYLQSTLSEQIGDSVDPLSSGFTMVGGSFDTGSYIFYAIA